MDSADAEVLRTGLKWLEAGHRALLATVVRTWGSAPRPPGSLMILREDGAIAGSVSGGCVEDDLIRRMHAGDFNIPRPLVVTYGATAEEARRFGLPCGGSLQFVLEPLTEQSGLRALLETVAAQHIVERTLDMATGRATLRAATAGDCLHFDGGILRTVLGPACRLLIIGAGQLPRYLAAMARMLDYRVTVCDPREEYLRAWEPMEGIVLADAMPDELAAQMKLDRRCAMVAATHDPALDDLALIQALQSDAFYVGALGSRRNNARRRKRLLDFDLAPEQVARLHGPVGLDLGAVTPAEIAVAIVAEMTAARRGRTPAQTSAAWAAAPLDPPQPACAALF